MGAERLSGAPRRRFTPWQVWGPLEGLSAGIQLWQRFSAVMVRRATFWAGLDRMGACMVLARMRGSSFLPRRLAFAMAARQWAKPQNRHRTPRSVPLLPFLESGTTCRA
jgi:hypothetical protein